MNKKSHEKGNGAELEIARPYNFEFIAASLGLFPVGAIAFNVAAVSLCELTENGAQLVIHGDTEIELSHAQLAMIEGIIKARIDQMERAKSAAGGKSDLIIPNFSMKAN